MEILSDLPPAALVPFGMVLAIIFGVRYLGLWQGERSGPSAKSPSAQVAAVIVDPTALNHAADAVRGLTDEMEALRLEMRELGREIARRG